MAMFSHRETKQPNPTPLPATPSRQNQVGTPGDEGGDERSYANTNGTSPKTGAGVSNATNEYYGGGTPDDAFGKYVENLNWN